MWKPTTLQNENQKKHTHKILQRRHKIEIRMKSEWSAKGDVSAPFIAPFVKMDEASVTFRDV